MTRRHRRRSFGALRRRRKKIRSAYWRIGTGSRQHGRHVKVDVLVVRGEIGRGGGGRVGYAARACVAWARGRSARRCGDSGEAMTPTAAVRKALRSLASRKHLR